MLGIEMGNTRPQFFVNSLWKRLWTCRKADYELRDNLQLWPRAAGWIPIIYVLFCCVRTQKIASNHVKVAVTTLRFDTAVADDNMLLSGTACTACYRHQGKRIVTYSLRTHTHTHTHPNGLGQLRKSSHN